MDRNRGVFIAGNWKMNHGPKAAREFFLAMKGFDRSKGLRPALFVPYLTLTEAQIWSGKHKIEIGAQNASGEKSGAFTGEISGSMLGEVGIKLVLIGHSERRQFFGDTDSSLKKRVEGLLGQGLEVLFCIGETKAERESGDTFKVLERQLSSLIDKAQGANAVAALGQNLHLAYEPVWAIGTGLTATPEQAGEAHAWIRSYLSSQVSAEASAKTQLLYGGSVTPENLDGLLRQKDIDGALVGGASLKPESYGALLGIAAKCLKSGS